MQFFSLLEEYNKDKEGFVGKIFFHINSLFKKYNKNVYLNSLLENFGFKYFSEENYYIIEGLQGENIFTALEYIKKFEEQLLNIN